MRQIFCQTQTAGAEGNRIPYSNTTVQEPHAACSLPTTQTRSNALICSLHSNGVQRLLRSGLFQCLDQHRRSTKGESGAHRGLSWGGGEGNSASAYKLRAETHRIVCGTRRPSVEATYEHDPDFGQRLFIQLVGSATGEAFLDAQLNISVHLRQLPKRRTQANVECLYMLHGALN